jgi:hypothetical protein
MALSSESFDKVFKFFKELDLKLGYIDCVDAEDCRDEHYNYNFPLNTIITHDRKSDGGVEVIEMRIKNIDKELLFQFHSNRNIIGNSSFLEEPNQNNITRFGWF